MLNNTPTTVVNKLLFTVDDQVSPQLAKLDAAIDATKRKATGVMPAIRQGGGMPAIGNNNQSGGIGNLLNTVSGFSAFGGGGGGPPRIPPTVVHEVEDLGAKIKEGAKMAREARTLAREGEHIVHALEEGFTFRSVLRFASNPYVLTALVAGYIMTHPDKILEYRNQVLNGGWLNEGYNATLNKQEELSKETQEFIKNNQSSGTAYGGRNRDIFKRRVMAEQFPNRYFLETFDASNDPISAGIYHGIYDYLYKPDEYEEGIEEDLQKKANITGLKSARDPARDVRRAVISMIRP